MGLKISVTGQLSLKQQLQVFGMTAGERKRLTKKMARAVKTASRQRIRQQRNLDGTPWAPRKGRSRRKMLRGLSKAMVDYATPVQGVVKFKGAAGRIAKEHQKGLPTRMTARRAQKEKGKPDYSAPATRRQASALKEAGFKRPREGGNGYSKATIKWITNNMTLGQAGLVLRMLTESEAKQSWVIELPARSFLGTTESERRELVQSTFEDTRQKMKAAKR